MMQLKPAPGKMPKSGSQFNAIFFFSLIENADQQLLRGKPKIKVQHNLSAVLAEKETLSVSFSFGENVEITRES